MSETRIRIEGVTKKYGDLVAVNNLNLSVDAGEVYALIGANGAGKSTLIRIITGVANADSGKIFINDEDLARRGPVVKKQIGYLPEELFLYNRLTGREYLKLVAGLKDALPESADEELQFFELGAVADKWVSSYSLGMRKKLGLAAAMTGSPDVLVLDEPLNGLDVEMMRKLRLRIEDERARGRAVLVSSHVMSFVERVSDRVGVMRDGLLVAEGSPRSLRESSRLVDAPFEDVFFYLAKGATEQVGEER